MSRSVINLYGDQLIETSGSHGADIASQRIDDLDRQALRLVLKLSSDKPVCVEYGCGLGWQGVRLALLGAQVHMYDLLPPSPLVQALLVEPDLQVDYHQRDLCGLSAEDLPTSIRIAFSQRTVHYLQWDAALQLVRSTADRMAPGAAFFISASGIESELGEGYAGSAVSVDRRFAALSRSMQDFHGIRERVCLYSEADLRLLMGLAGFTEVRVWKSSFGNIKGVFRRGP